MSIITAMRQRKEPTGDEDTFFETFGSTRKSRFTRHVILSGVGILMLYPLFWMVSSSLKPSRTVFTDTSLWPSQWAFENYSEGWTSLNEPFSLYLVNSAVIVSLSIIGNLFSCSLAAYGFARLDFAGGA